jgi:hypothetical protein
MTRAAPMLALLALTGCVERMVAIRSEPPGASVYLDGERVGETPVEIKYTWYGTRELIVEKRGYREIRRELPLGTPWWQIPPLDLVTDVILPFTIHDRTEVDLTLEPAPVTREELDDVLKRVAETREKAGISK